MAPMPASSSRATISGSRVIGEAEAMIGERSVPPEVAGGEVDGHWRSPFPLPAAWAAPR